MWMLKTESTLEYNKTNMQNTRIEAITEKTLVLGIDAGSETHYARVYLTLYQR